MHRILWMRSESLTYVLSLRKISIAGTWNSFIVRTMNELGKAAKMVGKMNYKSPQCRINKNLKQIEMIISGRDE